MKYTLSFFVGILFCLSTYAQAPEKMSYQAVVRDATNNLVVNTIIGMQSSILQGGANGAEVYVETQLPMTNENGLVSVEVGAGVSITGVFADIDWENGPYFIKTEFDLNGGTTYTIEGTSQLLSVPYALHAKTVEEKQTLQLSGNELSISDGNTVTLPNSVGGNQNKVWVILTDDINDTDAAAKLANEVGDATRFIYIQNTTSLTTVDLSGFAENQLIELKITNNEDLATVLMPQISSVFSAMEIIDNPSLEICDFQGVEIINSSVNIEGNSSLSMINFPSLLSSKEIYIKGHPNLSAIDFPAIQTATLIDIDENMVGGNLNLPFLTTLDEGLMVKNSSIQDIVANQLINNSILKIENNSLESIDILFDNITFLVFNDNQVSDDLIINNANQLSNASFNGNILSSFTLTTNSISGLFFSNNQVLNDVQIVGGNLFIEQINIFQNIFQNCEIDFQTCGNFTFQSNDFQSCSFTDLEDSGPIFIQSNTGNGDLNFSSLTHASSVQIQNNNVQTISLPELASIDHSFVCSNNQLLESIILGSLESLDSSFLCANNVNLSTLELGSFVNIFSNGGYSGPSSLNISNCNIPIIDLGNLVNVGTININDNDLLNSINLSALSNPSAIFIKDNQLLESIDLTSLNGVTGMDISDNASLSSVIMDSLLESASVLGFPNSFNFNNCALSSIQVNYLLGVFRTVQENNYPFYFQTKSFDFSGQNPPAPPSGQGIIDMNFLINTGGAQIITD